MIAAIDARTLTALLALLCLLTLATSASAECAWVLWGQTVNPNQATGFLLAIPLGGWNDRGECEKERLKKEQTVSQPRTSMFVCLPDTVDPRGPKGK